MNAMICFLSFIRLSCFLINLYNLPFTSMKIHIILNIISAHDNAICMLFHAKFACIFTIYCILELFHFELFHTWLLHFVFEVRTAVKHLKKCQNRSKNPPQSAYYYRKLDSGQLTYKCGLHPLPQGSTLIL